MKKGPQQCRRNLQLTTAFHLPWSTRQGWAWLAAAGLSIRKCNPRISPFLSLRPNTCFSQCVCTRLIQSYNNLQTYNNFTCSFHPSANIYKAPTAHPYSPRWTRHTVCLLGAQRLVKKRDEKGRDVCRILCPHLLPPLSPTFFSPSIIRQRPGIFYVIEQLLPLSLFIFDVEHFQSQCRCQRRRFDTWVGKIPWRRKWQPTPVFLPGESQGQRSLAGYSPWGHKKSDTFFICPVLYIS